MKYEFVIIWDTGEKEIHQYDDIETAERAEAGMKMAFGRQIEWSCIREAK